MADERSPLAACYLSSLSEFSNLELAALDNGLRIFGGVNSGSYCYDKCLKHQMIHKDGNFLHQEKLRTVVNDELRRRMKNQTFDQPLAPGKLEDLTSRLTWAANVPMRGHKDEMDRLRKANPSLEFFIGEPKATKDFNIHELKVLKMIGVYKRRKQE